LEKVVVGRESKREVIRKRGRKKKRVVDRWERRKPSLGKRGRSGKRGIE